MPKHVLKENKKDMDMTKKVADISRGKIDGSYKKR